MESALVYKVCWKAKRKGDLEALSGGIYARG